MGSVLGWALKGVVGLGAVLLAGCGSTNMTPNGPPQRPRAENCEFRLFTAPPAEPYTEVAAIDVQFGAYGTNAYTNLASFKRKIQPYVCRAGGDAAVAYANGYGMYIKATVLKALPAPAPVAAAAAPQPAASADTGCHYDAQCKGSRICVKGECVDSPASPTSAATPTTAAAPAAP